MCHLSDHPLLSVGGKTFHNFYLTLFNLLSALDIKHPQKIYPKGILPLSHKII
jgi:hypothetical protein